jgi:hypothetical protein
MIRQLADRKGFGVVISSRTPEGARNRCPICGKAVKIAPSRPFGDAPCPNCGCLLWFKRDVTGTRFSVSDAVTTEEIAAARRKAKEAEIQAAKMVAELEQLWSDFKEGPWKEAGKKGTPG